MNSENVVSPTPQGQTTLQTSQPMQKLSVEENEDFLAEPLKRLTPGGKTYEELSEQERRDFVIKLRDCRQSYQTYKATIEKAEEERVVTKKKSEPKPKLDKSFDELF